MTSIESVRRVMLVAVVCALMAGCAGGSGQVDRAVSSAGRVSREMTDLSHRLMRAWCPQAVNGGGRDLTSARARGCLQRAGHAYRQDLRAGGFDPRATVNPGTGR